MERTPNYELLKDAYAVLAGIPESQIQLDTVITKLGTGKHKQCGTIACGIGWLSLHPSFKKLLRPEISQSTCIFWKPVGGGNYRTLLIGNAAAAVFGVSYADGLALFNDSRAITDQPVVAMLKMRLNRKPTQKEVLLGRIEWFLRQHGQWKGLNIDKESINA